MAKQELETTEEDDRALRAAARLFRRKGFAATTVREIAREARMLPGSLHYRYASKDELLLALMERAVALGMAAVRAGVEGEDDPVERLRLGIRAHLNLLLAGDDAVFVLLYDWRSLEGGSRSRMVRLRDRYEAFWDKMIRDAVATGRVRQPVDVPLLRLFGFGAINWVATWYRPDGGRTPDELADAFWAVLAFGLLADGARPPDVDAVFAALTNPNARSGQPQKKRGGARVRIPTPRA